jgi:hypothetical protein
MPLFAISRKFFTRLDIQNILTQNELKAQVSYISREGSNNPDNYIIYHLLSPNKSLFCDNRVHIIKPTVQVVHYHKKKLDSISNLMLREFFAEPISFDITQQLGNDYLTHYYKFEIFTCGEW